jgi:tetratricopeptide (TPR) repeat protein
MLFPRRSLGLSLIATLFVLSLPAVSQIAQALPDQLRRVDPPNPSVSASQLEIRGDELRGMKYYADSVDYYMAALAKAPTPQVWNKLGMAEIGLMRLNDAKKAFEHAVKLNKNYPDALNNLGFIYYHDRNNRKAIRAYQKALKLDPDRASFHSNLGSALFAHKDYDKAAKEYARALQLDPMVFERHSRTGIVAQFNPEERGEFHYTVAKLYLKSGDVSHCLLYLKKAQEEGVKVSDKLQKDPELAKYRKDPRFISVVEHRPLETIDQQ